MSIFPPLSSWTNHLIRIFRPKSGSHHKMGQEKSLPVRCTHTFQQEYSTSTAPISRAQSRSTHSIKSAIASTTSTIHTARTRSSSCSAVSTTSSACSATSYKSIEKQAKYLKDQLHIKTYLDIIEEDRNAKRNFPTARSGIRNYTPKILLDENPPYTSSGSGTSSASSSSSEQDLDVWV